LASAKESLEAQPRYRAYAALFSIRVDASVSATEPRTPAQDDQEERSAAIGRSRLREKQKCCAPAPHLRLPVRSSRHGTPQLRRTATDCWLPQVACIAYLK